MAVRAYLMYIDDDWFLCFGEDAVEASEGLRAHGHGVDVDNENVSCSQGVNVEPQKAYRMKLDFGGVLLKDACHTCMSETNLSDGCCRKCQGKSDGQQNHLSAVAVENKSLTSLGNGPA